MKIYFDTCSLHRPLDDRTQLRIALEAEAVLVMLAKCEAGEWTKVSSEILSLEVEKNPDAEERRIVTTILASARIVVASSAEIRQRAKDLEKRGFKPFDSLHIASAESAGADYFCSCDDRVVMKARQQTDLTVKVLSPLELANEVSL